MLLYCSSIFEALIANLSRFQDSIDAITTMGVPFEALIPYGIMLTVRQPHPFLGTKGELSFADVRNQWSWTGLDQALAEWWEKSKTFG